MGGLYIGDPIHNNLKYNIQNIKGKYNRLVIPSAKWVYSKNNCIINVFLNLV